MGYPELRLRRLRENPVLRNMLSETTVSLDQLIYPLFATEGTKISCPVSSMPGMGRLSVDLLVEEAARIFELGIKAVLLFGIPENKDEIGSSAWQENGAVQAAIREIKKLLPEMLVISDVCMCEYTNHGHCGILSGNAVDNDATLELLSRVAVSHARAGADIVAPSDMMDGRVGAIRRALDHESFSQVPILAYSAKYSSAFYGPFRDIAQSSPQFGDRSGYQMNPANRREALREVALDIEEGADMVMVKPALAYLDIIADVKNAFLYPVVAYNVSGEYAMVKAAASMNWIDERRTVWEIMTAIKRAGADLIITYHAPQVALWIREGVFHK